MVEGAGKNLTRGVFIGVLALAMFLVVRSLPEITAFPLYARLVVNLVLEVMPWLLLAAALAQVPVPRRVLAGVLGRGGNWLIPVAPLLGLVLPVDPEEGGFPLEGLPYPLVLTLSCAMPVVNPVAIVATVMAFPGRPGLVAARFVGAWGVAVLLGLMALAWQVQPGGAGPAARDETFGSELVPRQPFATATVRRFLGGLGPVVTAALLVSLVRVVDGAALFSSLGPAQGQFSGVFVAVLVLFAGGYFLSLPAQADPFVVRFLLPYLPPPVLLAFMVTGPAINLRRGGQGNPFLTAVQAAIFVLLVVLVAGRLM